MIGGVSSAMEFLKSEDSVERNLMMGIAHEAIELHRELVSEHVNKQAKEIGRIFGGR